MEICRGSLLSHRSTVLCVFYCHSRVLWASAQTAETEKLYFRSLLLPDWMQINYWSEKKSLYSTDDIRWHPFFVWHFETDQNRICVLNWWLELFTCTWTKKKKINIWSMFCPYRENLKTAAGNLNQLQGVGLWQLCLWCMMTGSLWLDCHAYDFNQDCTCGMF